MLLKDWFLEVFRHLTIVKAVRIFFLLFMLVATVLNLFYNGIINEGIVKAFTISQVVGIMILSYIMGWTDGSGEQ